MLLKASIDTRVQHVNMPENLAVGMMVRALPHHIAVVAGDSLVVKPDNYFARIAFVDYDGPAAYTDYLKNPPLDEQGNEDFFIKHAARMLRGADALENFLNS
ncbi:MAG: hypothetical protein K0B84_03470 [Firmicutes bacterium]|nr:hypothetical protein [Bacillota bacterium]